MQLVGSIQVSRRSQMCSVKLIFTLDDAFSSAATSEFNFTNPDVLNETIHV